MVGDRLTHLLRSGDLAARICGDEFVVLADDVDAAKAPAMVDRLIAEVSAPYDLGEGILAQVGISVGIALSLGLGEDFTFLLSAADRALYATKLEGGGRCRIASFQA